MYGLASISRSKQRCTGVSAFAVESNVWQYVQVSCTCMLLCPFFSVHTFNHFLVADKCYDVNIMYRYKYLNIMTSVYSKYCILLIL